jgi:VPDSG-CTERM motif
VATLAIVIASLLSIQSAKADYIVTLQQVGTNVVATGTGTIDTTDLGTPNGSNDSGFIEAQFGEITTGPENGPATYEFSGISGPGSFGSGSFVMANLGSEDVVGIDGAGAVLEVPSGYVSGKALSDSSTYDGVTLANLGVTTGTYVWTWGTGTHADSFTLEVKGAAGVPDSGSTFGLLVLSLVACFGVSRVRSLRLA